MLLFFFERGEYFCKMCMLGSGHGSTELTGIYSGHAEHFRQDKSVPYRVKPCRAKLFVGRNVRHFLKNLSLSPDKVSPNKVPILADYGNRNTDGHELFLF